jgi:flagellar biosynthetic protein FliR
MRPELLSEQTLAGFAFAFARVSSLFWLMPLPGARSMPAPAKILISLFVTIALFPVWPVPDQPLAGAAAIAAGMAAHAAGGLALAVAIFMLLDAFQIGMQVVGLQAGYSYASTIDPQSEANSTVLQVFMVLLAGLLFFSLQLDHHILRLLAADLTRPGDAAASRYGAIQAAGAGMWETGVRLALPIVGCLLIVDLALALFGRLHNQIQLISLAFPIKMLLAVASFAAILNLTPSLFRNWAAKVLGAFASLP